MMEILGSTSTRKKVYSSLSSGVLTAAAHICVHVTCSLSKKKNQKAADADKVYQELTCALVSTFLLTHIQETLAQSLCHCRYRVKLAVEDFPRAMSVLKLHAPEMHICGVLDAFIQAVKTYVSRWDVSRVRSEHSQPRPLMLCKDMQTADLTSIQGTRSRLDFLTKELTKSHTDKVSSNGRSPPAPHSTPRKRPRRGESVPDTPGAPIPSFVLHAQKMH